MPIQQTTFGRLFLLPAHAGVFYLTKGVLMSNIWNGAIGSETIKSINAIPDNAVNEFMVALKSERIDYLQGTKNWVTAKNGWLKRVNKY